MPEGDTIYRTAVALRRWIGGREVTDAQATHPGVDASLLVATTVEEVEARAKHLLMRFSGGLVLHTHMRMTGSWHVYPTGERWRKPAHQARVVVTTGKRLAVCFNAPVIELLSESGERAHQSLRRLGPDVLLPEGLDPVEVRARARSRAVASPTAGEVLLDQQVVSGIGNVYRCEALFLCGVHPWLATSALDDGQLDRLVSVASRLMVTNAGISAFSRSFGGGPDRPWVYGRAGRPCRRCGTVVERGILGAQARSVYWCPTCQPRPG